MMGLQVSASSSAFHAEVLFRRAASPEAPRNAASTWRSWFAAPNYKSMSCAKLSGLWHHQACGTSPLALRSVAQPAHLPSTSSLCRSVCQSHSLGATTLSRCQRDAQSPWLVMWTRAKRLCQSILCRCGELRARLACENFPGVFLWKASAQEFGVRAASCAGHWVFCGRKREPHHRFAGRGVE
jgi:hypothetical protein